MQFSEAATVLTLEGEAHILPQGKASAAYMGLLWLEWRCMLPPACEAGSGSDLTSDPGSAFCCPLSCLLPTNSPEEHCPHTQNDKYTPHQALGRDLSTHMLGFSLFASLVCSSNKQLLQPDTWDSWQLNTWMENSTYSSEEPWSFNEATGYSGYLRSRTMR